MLFVGKLLKRRHTAFVVANSVKYRDYQRTIRERQIDRALKSLENGKASIESRRQNDPKRFIKADHSTRNGEAADKTTYYIDETVIREEAQYDGFYAVCTNLEDDAQAIVKINKRRWEIEECFRIMKSEFEARPVYAFLCKNEDSGVFQNKQTISSFDLYDKFCYVDMITGEFRTNFQL